MINFTNTGFINFNKDYNKVLKSGAITASMSMSQKNTDGDYENKYVNVMITKKALNKSLLNKKLCDVEGFITQSENDGKKYNNFVITKMTEHVKKQETDDDDLPF
ncbi:MAG: hypothetical protein MR841_05260 [Lactobacillus johnsonii]|nr:hypothetical protein [Lactobacillus johnsonii]